MRDYERLAFLHAPDATLILSERVILRASLRVEAPFEPLQLVGTTDERRRFEKLRHIPSLRENCTRCQRAIGCVSRVASCTSMWSRNA